MRALILVAGAALTLAACGGTDSATDEDNAMSTENLAIDDNAMLANDAGGLDANTATNAEAEANLVANDLTNNDADSNLANGI